MDAVATAKLALDASGMDRGLQSAGASVDKFAKQAGTALVGAFAMDKIIGGFATAIEKGDQLQDLANRFGVSAVSIQEIGNAASLSGAGVEDVAAAMNKLAKNAGEAIGDNTAMAASFERIGLSVADLKIMSPEDLFMALSKTLASGTIPQAEQLKLAMDLAGKSVGTLMETMRMGPDAIKEMGQAMGVFSSEEISQLGAASDAIKEFQTTQTLWFGKTLVGLGGLIERYQDLIAAIYLHIRANRDDQLDAAGRADLYEASAAKTADVVMGRSKIQKNAGGQGGGISGGDASSAAGVKAAAKDFADSEKQAAVQELKLIEAKIKGEEDAQKMAEKFEKDVAEEKIKLAKENADIQAKYEEDLFKAEQEAARFEQSEKARMMKVPRETQQAKAGAAGQVLDFASGLGDKGISDTVTRERAKAAKEQQKVNREEFDAKVRANTSATIKGSPRDMANRRAEFIKAEAGKEAKGQKTLADVYTVLDEALKTLLKAPIVGAGA